MSSVGVLGPSCERGLLIGPRIDLGRVLGVVVRRSTHPVCGNVEELGHVIDVLVVGDQVFDDLPDVETGPEDCRAAACGLFAKPDQRVVFGAKALLDQTPRQAVGGLVAFACASVEFLQGRLGQPKRPLARWLCRRSFRR